MRVHDALVFFTSRASVQDVGQQPALLAEVATWFGTVKNPNAPRSHRPACRFCTGPRSRKPRLFSDRRALEPSDPGMDRMETVAGSLGRFRWDPKTGGTKNVRRILENLGRKVGVNPCVCGGHRKGRAMKRLLLGGINGAVVAVGLSLIVGLVVTAELNPALRERGDG